MANFRHEHVFIITYQTVGGKRWLMCHSPMLCCLLCGFIIERAEATLCRGELHGFTTSQEARERQCVRESTL